MNFVQMLKTKIKIELNSEDLEKLNITYEEIDYNNEKTRKIICNLLLLAENKTDFDVKNSRVLVEAFPQINGGCELFITRLSPSPQLSKTNQRDFIPNSFYAFKFVSYEHLELTIKALLKSNVSITSSSLYKLEDAWILIINLTKDKILSADLIATQFGNRIKYSSSLKAHLEEYGKLICDKNATEIISSLLY